MKKYTPYLKRKIEKKKIYLSIVVSYLWFPLVQIQSFPFLISNEKEFPLVANGIH